MNQEDAIRIETRGHRAATLVGSYSIPALDTAASWRGNTRAAAYEPGGKSGWRYDEEGEPVPNDPTGEGSSTTNDQLRHPRLVAALGAYEIACANVSNLILNTVHLDSVPRPDGPGDGWCASCYRDDRCLQREDTHADGRTKHKNMCAWCAGFVRDYNRQPPIELLRWRHQGRRISAADIKAALAPKKSTPKKKRKRRAA